MTQEWFFLSKKKIIFLIIYYIILFFVGICITIIALLYESIQFHIDKNISIVSIIGGLGTSLLGSTIFYLRKLYKACINKIMQFPTDEEQKIREIGISTYYFLRPLFALGFSILIHITIKSGVQIITVKEAILDEGFIYLSMFLSFFAGFAAGDLITHIESNSTKLITKIFNR